MKVEITLELKELFQKQPIKVELTLELNELRQKGTNWSSKLHLENVEILTYFDQTAIDESSSIFFHFNFA